MTSGNSGTSRGRTSLLNAGMRRAGQRGSRSLQPRWFELKADLIITTTTPAALAARNATTTIPIVIPTAIDPVGTGLIASLAHPGGNITGGAILVGELAAKRLQLLKEVVPNLSRTGVLWNSANPANALALKETDGAARAIGVTLQSHEVKGPKDFEVAFARMAEERLDALFVLDDALTIQYGKQIADFAMQKRLPSVFSAKDGVEAGGLMTYGPRYSEMMRRAASLVDKILRGAEPASLPMEQPDRVRPSHQPQNRECDRTNGAATAARPR